jgi:hypothetical protein
MKKHEISFNTRRSEAIRTRADFIYHMGPDWITIADTGKGNCSVADDLESVLRKIEYWHQGSITKFKIIPGLQRILARSWVGRPNGDRTRSAGNRRAKGKQEVALSKTDTYPREIAARA